MKRKSSQNLSYCNGDNVSVFCKLNYITTNVSTPLVIYITFSMIII